MCLNDNTIWIHALFQPVSEEPSSDLDYELKAYTIRLRGQCSPTVYHRTMDCQNDDDNLCVGSESLLISSLWRELTLYGYRPAGWRISETIWPRFINRSIHHKLDIPVWAVNSLKRFVTVNMVDPALIYRQGVYEGIRPLPELHEAIRLWTGTFVPSEDELLEIINEGDNIHEYSCEILDALDNVTNRYYGNSL